MHRKRLINDKDSCRFSYLWTELTWLGYLPDQLIILYYKRHARSVLLDS